MSVDTLNGGAEGDADPNHHVSFDTLRDFFTVLPHPENGLTVELSIDDLSDPLFLLTYLRRLWPEGEQTWEFPAGLPEGIAGIGTLLGRLDAITDRKYTARLASLLAQVNSVSAVPLPYPIAISVGETLIVAAVESQEAAAVISGIVTDLSENSQYEIQSLLQRFNVTEEDSDAESFDENESTDDNRKPAAERQAGYARQSTRRTSQRVPPLSLRTLKRLPTVKFPEAKNGPDSHNALDSHNAFEGANIWKQRHDELKKTYQECLAAKDEALAKVQQLEKKLTAVEESHLLEVAEIKLQLNAVNATAHRTADALEREVDDLKTNEKKLKKSKDDLETSLTAQIERLRDENQLLSADAERIVILEEQIETLKKREEQIEDLREEKRLLEEKTAEYRRRAIRADTLQSDLEAYKEKVAILETKLMQESNANTELDAALKNKTREAEDAQKELENAKKKLETMQVQYAERLATARAMLEPTTDDIDKLRQQVIKLEEENEQLLHRSGNSGDMDGKVAELRSDLDDAHRIREKLEAALSAAQSRITRLEASGPTDARESLSQLKELELARVQIDSLKAQVDALKIQRDANMSVSIETARQELEQLKRDAEFNRLTMQEKEAVHRNEQRLMASAFHELGYRYFRLRTQKEKNEAEFEAIFSKLQGGRKSGEYSGVSAEDDTVRLPTPGARPKPTSALHP